MDEYITVHIIWLYIVSGFALIVLGFLLSVLAWLLANNVRLIPKRAHRPRQRLEEQYDASWQDYEKYMESEVNENLIDYIKKTFERN